MYIYIYIPSNMIPTSTPNSMSGSQRSTPHTYIHTYIYIYNRKEIHQFTTTWREFQRQPLSLRPGAS